MLAFPLIFVCLLIVVVLYLIQGEEDEGVVESIQRRSIAPFSSDVNSKTTHFGSADDLDNYRESRPGSPLQTGSGAGGVPGGMAPLHKQVKRVSG